jgi:hypothetical protein
VGDDVVELARDPRALLGDRLLGTDVALGHEHALALAAVAHEAPDDPGILLAIYSVGRYARGRAEVIGVALIVAAIPAAAIEPGNPTTFSDVAFCVVFCGGP